MPGETSRANGRKGGRHKSPLTLDKLAAREFVRRRVTAELGPMIDAQIANAKGINYLVTRDPKTKQFTRVTPSMALAANEAQAAQIEVWEKDPSVPAFTDLLNRALDKPAEQKQELDLAVELKIGWLE
jgi:hypothetical protein